MPAITSATLQTLQNSFKALFIKGLQRSGEWEKVATMFRSSGPGTVYSWLGAFPKMKEWTGTRQLEGINASDYTLKNRNWANGIDVLRSDIEDDNLGIFGPLFEQLGQSAAEHIDEQVFLALVNGFTDLCYDGKPFFAADHPIYPNEDGTGTASTFSNIVGSGTGTPWFLLDTTKVVKPIIYQNRQDARFIGITDPHAESVFMQNTFRYGADARRAFGYTFPQLAVASKDTLNAANFMAAFSALEGMRLDGNRPMNVMASILVVPPSLRSAAEEILEKQLINGGESNVNYHRVELLVTPFAIAPEDDGDEEEDDDEGEGQGR